MNPRITDAERFGALLDLVERFESFSLHIDGHGAPFAHAFKTILESDEWQAVDHNPQNPRAFYAVKMQRGQRVVLIETGFLRVAHMNLKVS